MRVIDGLGCGLLGQMLELLLWIRLYDKLLKLVILWWGRDK